MTLALTAFLTGLLSGVHCIAMCGGVVSALSMSARGRAAVRVQGGGAAALGGAASSVSTSSSTRRARQIGRAHV